ncbi:MAG: phosphatidate cytidylyltransferase [Lachnospiraceae bacterium]|nr:phosphatidate cytidylyltransferase [Lachnospiraceae bacterium]
MLKRTLSGAVLVAVAFAAFWFGGYVLLGITLFLSILGMFELFRVFEMQKSPHAFLGYAAAAAYDASLLLKDPEKYFIPGLCVFLLLTLIIYVLSFPNVKAAKAICVPFVFLYVAFLFGFLYRIRVLDGGVYLVWIVLLGAWGSDTFAYLAGVLFGKHKAFPRLSPKKTWEGCVGGVLGASILCGVYGLCLGSKLPSFDPLPAWAALAIVGACSAVLSMFGDLTASAIKRDHGVKDYGKLIPGHGGVMDRFDSVLFTAPAVYLLITVLL